ncbi:MAG: helix-turn-helix transcriptional regulator, partial [Clostridia bacterium]|nr:helix-turn-helix transcriptional regulator [Clostridia bacterium]
EDRDLKQTDLAEILKTNQSYYAKYENGKRPIPVDRIITLCKYYNLSADYILCLTDDPRPLIK